MLWSHEKDTDNATVSPLLRTLSVTFKACSHVSYPHAMCLESTAANVCILSKWLSVRVFTVLSVWVQWLIQAQEVQKQVQKQQDVAGTATALHIMRKWRSDFSFFQCIFKLFYLFLAAMGLRLRVGFLVGVNRLL